MTNPNSSDRLDRIEAALEQTQQQVDTNTRNIQQLAGIAQTQQQTLQMQEQGNNQIFEALIEEIRGLRTENRRILDHLFGRAEGGEQ